MNKGLLWSFSKLIFIILLILSLLSLCFGLSTNDWSFSQLLEKFANSPVYNVLNTINGPNGVGSKLFQFKELITIDTNVNIKSLETFFTAINSFTSAIIGIINFVVTLGNIIISMFAFVGYLFSTLLI